MSFLPLRVITNVSRFYQVDLSILSCTLFSSTELRQCVKQIVADQCGDEIADALNDIAGQVIDVLDCDDASSSSSDNGPASMKKIRRTNTGL